MYFKMNNKHFHTSNHYGKAARRLSAYIYVLSLHHSSFDFVKKKKEGEEKNEIMTHIWV